MAVSLNPVQTAATKVIMGGNRNPRKPRKPRSMGGRR